MVSYVSLGCTLTRLKSYLPTITWKIKNYFIYSNVIIRVLVNSIDKKNLLNKIFEDL